MKAKIFQGEDKSFNIETDDDLSSATEIEVTVDTPAQIKKSLSGGGISAVTSTQFTVQFDAADTATTDAGVYKWQVRATIAGDKSVGKFSPNAFQIMGSVFENAGSGNDYN